MSDITSATGVSKGAIYHHFPHKEAIGLDVVEENTLRLITALQGISGSSALAPIPQIFNIFYAAALENETFSGNAVIAFNLEFRHDSNPFAQTLRTSLKQLMNAITAVTDVVSAEQILAELIGAETTAPWSGAQQAFADATARVEAFVAHTT